MTTTYLKNNLALMAISMMLSVLLWFTVRYINAEPEFVKQETVDVALFYREPAGTLVRTAGPNSVRVIIEGTDEQLKALDRNRITATVDLNEGEPGQRNYPVTLNAPAAARKIELVNNYVQVTLEPVVQVSKNVEIATRGRLNLQKGMFLTSYTTQPETAQLSAPTRFLSRVTRVQAVFNLNEVEEGKVIRADLEALDADGKAVPFVRIDPTEVVIAPTIMPDIPEKQLLVVPEFRGAPAFGFEVTDYEVTPNQATVRGEFADLASAYTIRTEPIDLTGLGANKSQQVKLVVPRGLELKGSDRVRVMVRLRRTAAPEPANDGRAVGSGGSESP